MYRRYQENPKAVAESWRDFFEDYRPAGVEVPERDKSGDGAVPQAEQEAAPPKKERPRPEPVREERPSPVGAEPVAIEGAVPLRGIAARIAENMDASLAVPTATSVRRIPAKLLEENRRVINRYLATRRGGKVSFTHLIGWAILKGLESRPRMKSVYAEVDSKPHVIEQKHVNFGLAVDVERSGGRILVVPNIKDADELDFEDFFTAYEELIRNVKSNQLAPEDFAGTTMTL